MRSAYFADNRSSIACGCGLHILLIYAQTIADDTPLAIKFIISDVDEDPDKLNASLTVHNGTAKVTSLGALAGVPRMAVRVAKCGVPPYNTLPAYPKRLYVLVQCCPLRTCSNP